MGIAVVSSTSTARQLAYPHTQRALTIRALAAAPSCAPAKVLSHFREMVLARPRVCEGGVLMRRGYMEGALYLHKTAALLGTRLPHLYHVSTTTGTSWLSAAYSLIQIVCSAGAFCESPYQPGDNQPREFEHSACGNQTEGMSATAVRPLAAACKSNLQTYRHSVTPVSISGTSG